MTTLNLQRLGEPNVRITGTVITAVSQDARRKPEGDVWELLTLMVIADGRWVAIGQRLAPNIEGLVGDYRVIRKPEIASGTLIPATAPKNEADVERMMAQSVMKFFEWSVLAKKMAAELGWPVEHAVS